MVIGEYVSFGHLDQVDQGMQYPDSPPETMGLPYRVSAYVKNVSGSPSAGIDVSLYNAQGAVVATKKTDSSGRVFFDVATKDKVSLKPDVPNVSPPYAEAVPADISVGIFAHLFKASWDWKNTSLQFTVFPSSAPVSPGSPGMPAAADGKTLLWIAGALVVAYFVYQRFGKES